MKAKLDEKPEAYAANTASLISIWDDFLGLKLCDLTFLSDRIEEFAELSAHLKDHVKTARYFPEANGKIERSHMSFI